MAITGQLTINQTSLIEVDSDPTVVGVSAALGSIAIIYDNANARLWMKTGAGDTAWTAQPKIVPGTSLQNNTVVLTDASGQLRTNTTQMVWDSTNARLGIGLAAPASPVNTIHIDRGTAQGSGIKFTAGTTTGQTSGDGFSLGIDAAGAAFLTQYENNPLTFQVNNTRVMTLLPTGQTLIGQGTTLIDVTGAGAFPLLEIIGSGAVQMAQIQYSADTIAPVFNSIKSRNATIGSQGLVLQDDELGRFQFRGSDGVNFQAGASIRSLVDGVAAAGSMPGRLILMTTPAGSTVPVEAVRINNSQHTIFANLIRPGNTTDTTAGNIRFNGTDFEGYANGDWYSLTGGLRRKWTYAMTATQSSTSTTPANVTQLTTGVLPVGRYTWRVIGLFQSAATGTGMGIRIGLGTAVVGALFGEWRIGQAGNGTTANYQYTQLNATTNVTSASVAAANTNDSVIGQGTVTVTTAGTLAVQFRTEVNASAVTLQANTVLVIEEC